MVSIKKLGLGLSAVVLVSAMTLGCSSSDDKKSDDSSDTTVTTAAGDSGTEETDETMESTAGDDSSSEGSANASVVFSDGEAPADRTITVTDAGFSPDSLEVNVGDKVTFVAGADGGIFGIVVGDVDSRTVTTGIYESYEFPEAGTVDVSEEISGNTATITVK